MLLINTLSPSSSSSHLNNKTTMTFSTVLCIKPFSSTHLHRPRPRHDPSSPKVGCMGQVRPPLPHPSHPRGRRFYFFMASVASFVSPMNVARKRRPAPMGRKVASVEEMDLPLPVAAAKKKEEKEEMTTPTVSLWRRRCRSRKLEELLFSPQENLPVAVAVLVV